MKTRRTTLLTRRQILRAATLGGGTLALAACGGIAPVVGGTPVVMAASSRTVVTAPAAPAVGEAAAAGTAHGAAATPSPAATDASLEALLATIPAGALEPTTVPGTVWYADLLAQRQRHGFAAIDSADRLLALPPEEFRRFVAIYNGLPLAGLFGGAISGDGVAWRPLLGFDSFQFDRAVYTGPHVDFAAWQYAEGALDPTAIAARLGAIGYAPRPYRDAAILVRGEQIAAVRAAEDAGGFALATAEALPGAGTLLTTRYPGGIAATLDARAGAAPTLADDPTYRAAAAALGPVVGAALVLGATLLHPSARGIVVAPPATPAPYATALPPYRVAGFGFADDGAARRLTLALVYDDPATAAMALPILRERLTTHRLDPRLARDGRAAFLDYFALGEARLVAAAGRAALVQPLPLTGDWASLWLTLLKLDQVGFLREQ